MSFSSLPGQRLREQRKARGWTQSEAAAACEVSREMWGKYERGSAKPGADVLARMGAVGLDVIYILTAQPPLLRRALANQREAADAVSMLADGEAAAGLQGELIYQVRDQARGLTGEENRLLVNYRRCAPPDQKTIRQMAARLAGDAPAEPVTKMKR